MLGLSRMYYVLYRLMKRDQIGKTVCHSQRLTGLVTVGEGTVWREEKADQSAGTDDSVAVSELI